MSEKIPSSEITPREVYLDRRSVLRGGILAASAAATAYAYRRFNGVDLVETSGKQLKGVIKGVVKAGEMATPKRSIVNYNNFYEFTTNKDAVAAAAKNFKTDGWKIEVGGLVGKPRTFDLDDFRAIAPPEERVYRHRCVEAWSMVVPWDGFSVKKLLDAVEPLGSAKYVAFETLLDPKRFPNQGNSSVLDWPYVEGLRIDEAMHPLAIFATGLYGEELPPQDGAPVKLVVPWKYGFFANVNPHHDHPRWSQMTEQRIGEKGRRVTLMFNGYADEVASLYTGMDLDVYY